MDLLVRALGPGVHYYLPFRRLCRGSRTEVADLQQLCKRCILNRITLRKLHHCGDQLRLPPIMIRYLTSLSTENFEEVECAPLSDLFSANFFHRALTYRVLCRLDNQEYLAVYGSNPADPEEEVKYRGGPFRRWVKLQHLHVMCVYAIITDLPTGNEFYLMDVPQVSLEHLSAVLANRGRAVPERLLWRLMADLGSALQYVLAQGLSCSQFGLQNVFIVGDRIALESEITRKPKQKKTILSERAFGQPATYGATDLECEAAWGLVHLVRRLVELSPDDTFYSPQLRDLVLSTQNNGSLADMRRAAEAGFRCETDSVGVSFLELSEGLRLSTSDNTGAT